MSTSKIILVLIKTLIEILLSSMKNDEKNLDTDGVPLNLEEYDRCGFLLASFRDILKGFDDNFDGNGNEK